MNTYSEKISSFHLYRIIVIISKKHRLLFTFDITDYTAIMAVIFQEELTSKFTEEVQLTLEEGQEVLRT